MDLQNKHKHLIQLINQYGNEGQAFFLIVDFLVDKPLLFTPEELLPQGIEVVFPTFQNSIHAGLHQPFINLIKYPITLDEYEQAYHIVQRHLRFGNSFLTNLCCKTPITTNCTVEQLFYQANAPYKIKFKDEWICFSPERFIQIDGRYIHSFPMKGTIDAAIPNAEEEILSNPKETAEHYTIVDLIRNDLSMVSKKVEVKTFRFINVIKTNQKTLLQVSSHVQGLLPENFRSNLGTLLFTLLPAGSISGAPKQKTLEIIAEAETSARNYYTGVAFYFDGKVVDSCVLIRYIEQDGKNQYYRSGGGITIHSDLQQEYNELIDKIYLPTL